MAKSIYKNYNVVDYFDFEDKILAKTDQTQANGMPRLIHINKNDADAGYKKLLEEVEAGEITILPKSDYQYQWLEGRLSNMDNGGYGNMNEQWDYLYTKTKELGAVKALEAWVDHVDAVKLKFPKS